MYNHLNYTPTGRVSNSSHHQPNMQRIRLAKLPERPILTLRNVDYVSIELRILAHLKGVS